jgi:hypothetical protein
MKPYVVTLIQPEEVNLFRAVSWVVDSIPDRVWVEASPEGALRCHELARAVCDWVNKQPANSWGTRPVNLGVIDGSYAKIEHSWLETGFGENILDVYVPGELPPVQLRHGSKFLPGQYVPGRLRGDIRESVIEQLITLFETSNEEFLHGDVSGAYPVYSLG